jgi:hypothetical protein
MASKAWFGSSSDYDDQAARGLLECPLCGSKAVRKQIMAPAVAGTKARGAAPAPDAKMREVMMAAMGEMRPKWRKSSTMSATASPGGARHPRGQVRGARIYGEASPKEVKALVEDGIKVAPLPPAPPKKSEVN